MARAAGPMTAAERQRAFRQRAKKNPNSVSIPRIGMAADDGDGEPPDGGDDEADVSLAELNARMRRMAAQAFDEVGGVQFLKRVAAKNANTFLRFMGQFVSRDDLGAPGGFNVLVQRIVIESAQPVPGVISSPIAGHIAVQTRFIPAPATLVVEQVDEVEGEVPDAD